MATAERPPAQQQQGAGWGNGNGNGGNGGSAAARGGTATAAPPQAPPPTRAQPARRAAEDAIVMDEAARLRQRRRFGGFNFGAGFFGWIVAIGIGTLLTAIVAAAGTAIRLTNTVTANDATKNAGTIGIVGGALLLAIGAIAYFAGGYVAGRMSRFDGGRQGFGTWLIGLVVTLAIGAAGAIFGSQYNVLGSLHLPRIPIDEGSLTTGGAIFLGAFLILTLLAAIVGGISGRRYHLRVDRAAMHDA